MSVRYTSSDGGTCAAEGQRRVNAIVSADQEASATTFPYPQNAVVLNVASNHPEDFVGDLVTTTGLVATTYGFDLTVAARTSAEISADYSLLYQTVTDAGKAVPLVDAFTGSPFIIEHATMQYDSAGVLQTTAAEAVLLPRTNAYAAPVGTYVPAATVQFSAVGSRMIARVTGDARFIHRFTLRWVLSTGDWNTTTGPAANGWTVLPYANPFASASPAVTPEDPPMITFTVRVTPE
jgi:hypothetical protein